MIRRSVFSMGLALAVSAAMGQSVTYPEDAQGRGFTDRPYLRYEAEEGRCAFTAGEYIASPTFNQSELASEASNLQALSLAGKGSSVQWTLDADANALSIRFSLPDTPDGTGTKATVGIYRGSEKIADVTLDSYWAWQYSSISTTGEKYPDNKPGVRKFARMRFDEAYALLPAGLKKGETLRLVVESDTEGPVTIDFVEAETAAPALTLADFDQADAVEYKGDGSDLQAFINRNQGKLIFIPAGRYEIPAGLTIPGDGTRISGAGMWHTELYFKASSDNIHTYSRRGITCNANRCALENLSLNTVNNKRYYENNSAYQVGKGLMGSWGEGSAVRHVRVDHFECGGWIADYTGPQSRNLTVEYCRFRNNYADGINLCSGTGGANVSHCSFRNNGDDDMASWSTGQGTFENTFSYCTAENNWRASSLGFFGGRDNKAHHIAIYDAMESGARINADFPGPGFASTGEMLFSDITIRRCGTEGGQCGVHGDFWGNGSAALLVDASGYDVNNVRMANIDIYDCRHAGLMLRGSHKLNNLKLSDINVNTMATGSAYSLHRNLSGFGEGHNLMSDGQHALVDSDIPANFDFTLSYDTQDLPFILAGDKMRPGLYTLTGVLVPVGTIPSSGVYVRVETGKAPRKLLIR